MSREFISAVYDAKTLTVDFAANDGTHLLRTGGTIAWRFNNPGNLRGLGESPSNGAIGIGITSGNGKFLIFRSYEDGRRQKSLLLRRKFNDRTIYTMLAGIPCPAKPGQLMMGYAPASDGNDPVDYANMISQHTGLPITTRLSEISDAKLQNILDAMEIKEGFHGMKQTRREREVATTTITISDGARPKSNVQVQIKIGDETHEKKTDRYGQLPIIAHLDIGQNVEVKLLDENGVWSKQLEFEMNTKSNSYLLLNDFSRYESPTAPKKPPSTFTETSRKPFDYPVGYGETLESIADRFSTSAAELTDNNPSIEKIGKVYIGQILGIYGPPSALSTSHASVSKVDSACVADDDNDPLSFDSVTLASNEAVIKSAYLARSKSGRGEPLAVLPVDNKIAPWMAVAIDEAKRWAGKNEEIISQAENFHKMMGLGGELTKTPWCAAFVNYCLKTSGTEYEKSASSQFACSSPKFIKIDKPVYGALMVLRNYSSDNEKYLGNGHVTFVYGKTEAGAIAGLGGNQGDMIKITDFRAKAPWQKITIGAVRAQQRIYAFYVPITYFEFAQLQDEANVVNVDEANRNLLNVALLTTSDESTR